jgi:peptidyl-prolyl cis-trans isomerase C
MKPAPFLMIALVCLLCGIGSSSAQDDVDEIALFVNDQPIYSWELKLLLPQIQSELAAAGISAKGEEVLNRTVSRAVDSFLLVQEAKERGIAPNETRIDEKLSGMADRAGGRAALEAELIKSGITFDQLRSSVVQADLVQTLVETEIVPGIQVTEEDVEAFYAANPELFTSPDKIHSRHILFMAEAGATESQRETARRRAEAARTRALAGEDFASLAAELSEGPTAKVGGDLGFTTRGQMLEAFDDAVWALEPGEISEVVESRIGYHVIKVEEIVPGSTVALDEAQPLITDLIRQRRTAAAIEEFMAGLREGVEIRDPQQ